MSTAILTTFHSRENFANALSKILNIPREMFGKVGVTLTRKMKAHTIWVSYKLPNGWITSTFVSRAKFQDFHTEEVLDIIRLTELATGMIFRIKLKSRLEWDKPLESNLRCSCDEHECGQQICKHIAYALTTELGMNLISRLENMRAAHQKRMEEVQRREQERQQRRRESLAQQEAWVQKKFHLKNRYKPTPGFWLEETAGKGKQNFNVMCIVESWGNISTENIGTISSDGESFNFYNRRCDFGDLILDPDNLAQACEDLFKASPHSYKTLCYDWEMEDDWW